MKAQRDAAILELRLMLDEIARARGLTAQGQSIPAMRALLQAKRLGKETIATLLDGCLKTEAKQTDDVSFARLREQIGFAQQSLCSACRSEVGRKWKEVEDV